MEPIARVEAGDDRDRLCRNRHDRRELAALEHIERGRLIDVHRLDVEAEALEHRAAGVVGAAALDVEADLLAGELPDVGSLARRDDMELVVQQTRDVGDLLVDVRHAIVLAQLVKGVGAHKAKVDASQEADVVGVLAGALAEDWQDAQVVAIIEDKRHVARHAEIGPAWRARDDRNGVGVHALADRRLAHRWGLRSGPSARPRWPALCVLLLSSINRYALSHELLTRWPRRVLRHRSTHTA